MYTDMLGHETLGKLSYSTQLKNYKSRNRGKKVYYRHQATPVVWLHRENVRGEKTEDHTTINESDGKKKKEARNKNIDVRYIVYIEARNLQEGDLKQYLYI